MTLFDNRVLVLALSAVVCFPFAANAQTQAAMAQDACSQYKKADQALNATYA